MIQKLQKYISGATVLGFSVSLIFLGVSTAQAQEIDVSYLQTCLKEDSSSLDVLVLMDGSASLRNSKPGDPAGYAKFGSDPERKRGKILISSLKLLQTLADESNRDFNISLQTFGNNSDPKELKNLEAHSFDWMPAPKKDLTNFIEKALYDDSNQTEWASGLASAKNQFKKQIGKATLEGKKSCPIMFWITDGAPTDSTDPICASNTNSSIDWFRENNILVLGGLLQPQDAIARQKASQFRPIVTGENCGKSNPGWTKGEVIEAKDIGDLAWGFVGLVASIKNLINLNGTNSSFYVDPGSSHIEVFFRTAQSTWSIKAPDGSTFCSSDNRGNRCKVSSDPEIGIVTVTIFPENPAKNAGEWKISPNIRTENFKVYASLNTSSQEAQKTQPRLIVTAKSATEIDEGKYADFNARIIYPDGTDFATIGFKNVSICAKVASSNKQNCKNGSSSADLTVLPSISDKTVSFEAILTSSFDDERNYRIAASTKISVIPSGVFPSLTCSKDPCVFNNLKNKKDISINSLEVKSATSTTNDGLISLVDLKILSDSVEKRGDGNFNFVATKSNGEKIKFSSDDQFLKPGEKLNLALSTDIAGDSEIQGFIKYKVYSGDQEIVRQLDFRFKVGHETNLWVQIALLLIAYLITIGIPYFFLLWSARKSAVLNVADNEIAFLTLPFKIDSNGNLFEKDPTSETIFTPDYKKLVQKEVKPNSRSVMIENVLIEVVPPRWNPFSSMITTATLKGNYLFSTYGVNSLSFEQIKFSPTLLDEAIFVFPVEGNITASKSTNQEIVSDDSGLGFLDSAYETKITEVIEKPSSLVTGTVLFVVSPYVNQEGLNKEKSLLNLVGKIPPIVKNLDLAVKIDQLREFSLQEAKAKADAEMIKSSSKGKKNLTSDAQKPADDSIVNSGDEWGSSAYTSKIEKDLPDSKQSDDSW